MRGLIPAARSCVYQCRRPRLRPVTRIQKLTRFQDHFDDMRVAVIFCALAWLSVKEEDIHLVGAGAGSAAVSGSGTFGNTFWLKRSSAFAVSIPR